jgi:cyclopropane fatty-acyl-phospholipid synthase-like methyltransferase
MSETIEYYEKNAQDFAASTADIEFPELQDIFLAELKNGASVLDFGCGSGRDTCYFLKKGYKVTALDGSAELCRIAEEKTGNPVIQMDFNDFDEQDRYDGIWACSSILHLSKQELKQVLVHMEQALHKGGIIYTSFKYSEFEGMRNGRYFADFTEDSFRAFISEVEQLTVEKLWVTSDVRPGRQDEKWLNMILRTTRR